MSDFSSLFPALVECFAIILFGYISGRLNVVTPSQGKGIGSFIGTFALPALLFKSMVELDFSTVSWAFMVAVLLGKALVFIVVFGFSVVLLKPRGVGRGALYALFTTQSNDFALGYPLVQALYGKTHPEYLQYIYLLAPISLLILNPIGFMLMEIDKVRHQRSEYIAVGDDESTPGPGSGNKLNSDVRSINESEEVVEEEYEANEQEAENPEERSGFSAQTCIEICKGVLLNPLVFMVFVGLIGHFVFDGKLPNLLGDTLTTLGNAFSGAALFYLGLTMVGKISQQKGIGLVIPASLIAAKIVLLPILIREFVLSLSNVLPVYRPGGIARNSTNMSEYIYSLADFGYLYGTFPTAPTVILYAAKYGIEMDRLASGMVFCTSLSAPLMYISAWTLSMSRMSAEFFQKGVKEVDKDISIISLFCSVWCIVIFILGKKFLNVPHVITFSLMFSLFISSLGTILWDSIPIDRTGEASKLIVFGMMYLGVQSARLHTASLAGSLLAIVLCGQRWLWKRIMYFIAFPYILSFIVTVTLIASGHRPSGKPAGKVDDIFEYGQAQDIASFVVLILSLLATVVSLIIFVKVRGRSQGSEVTGNNFGDSRDDRSPLLSRFQINMDSSSTEEEGELEQHKRRTFCFIRTRQKFGDIQKGRHIVLLLLLVLSMFIGLCIVSWRLSKMKQIGIYFELSFLDSVFNFGQGFFVFCVFGLDSDLIIDPFVRLYRKLRYGSEDIILPHLSTVDRKVLLRCLQFIRYHMDDCKVDILGEHRSGMTLYSEVFTGTDFCTWMVARGLVGDRVEATIYGDHLMRGHVLYHHNHKHYFHDQNYLYKFEEPKNCCKLPRTSAITKGDSLPVSGSPVPSTTPSTSSPRHQVPTPARARLVASPDKKWYHGYSFQAYVHTSDADSVTLSPKRQPVTKVKSVNRNESLVASSNNNCNMSDSSTDNSSFPQQRRRKKMVKSSSRSRIKMIGGSRNDLSDSSF